MLYSVRAKEILFFTLLITAAACGIGNANTQRTPLTEAGNDAFGTIQEAITALLRDPNTDWSSVDTEALRQHLIDMKHFTENVVVLEKTDIPNGLFIRVKALADAKPSVERAMAAHPAQLELETGWKMEVEQTNDTFDLTITTENETETQKIRGLGYIGLMAYGDHHQLHHWMMVNGHSAHIQE